MAKELQFQVSEILRKPQGTREEYSVDVKPGFDNEFVLKSNLKAKVVLMSLQEEIHVEVRDVSVKIEFICSKCLKKYSRIVKIPVASGEYLLDPPKHTGNEEEYFLIDKKSMTLDITELLRQEIVLHFPLISVCSKSCKGLCPKCGCDLNKKKCGCKVNLEEKKPLAILQQFK